MATRRLAGMELAVRFPPSAPCACEVCRAYCQRPGWWSVAEALRAFRQGYGRRMMLEIAPDRSFGVLAPAFRGCEGSFATNRMAGMGCTFLQDGRCELFNSGFQPLECRFCHHERAGQGPACHQALEQDWQTAAGHLLVQRWCRSSGLWACLDLLHLQRLKR